MSYAQISETFTRQGCRVITIRSVYRKEFIEQGERVGYLLTPAEHIFLSCPEDESDG